MSEKSSSWQFHSKLRRFSITLFQVFIVICLVDGFLDITYPLAAFTRKNFKVIISDIENSGSMEFNKSGTVVVPSSGLPSRNEPGIKNIPAEYHSTSINVNANGLRDNGQSPPDTVNHVGVLIGSSTAFGYGVADNQTIAANLERKLSQTQIHNYAGLGQSVPDNILRWYDVQKKNGKPDFVILAGANYQLANECVPVSGSNTHARSNIFFYLNDKIISKFLNDKIMPCASTESLELAIRSSILSIENAIAFARKNEIPFYIIHLPSPYDANVNINNLLNTTNATDDISQMRRVFSRYHQELAKLDIPELIDLSDALPTDKTYFLDFGGHLSKEGNSLISERIFDHIQDRKSGLAIPSPQQTY